MQARQTHATRLPMLLRALAFALLVAAPVASAQQPAPRPIEQQMSAAERAATGVDTLNADQLAALNAWLNRTLEVETAKAAEAAKATVVEQARGFFDFGSEEPIRSTIPGDFRGFGKGRTYTLANGQVWEQVDSAEIVGARLKDPATVVTPSRVSNVWYLSVDGFNTRAKVRRIK